jgi:hypothetical protein
MLTRLFLLSILLFAAVANAADVAVRTQMSRMTSVIGDPVQLEIRVSGARHLGSPPEIKVDGLDIEYAGSGSESQIRMENGSFSRDETIVLNYQIVPQRNGSFTIPAVTVEADGKNYSTKPVGLTVQPSSATNGEVDTDQLSFAEIVVPKKTIYLGEAIPVEVRLYVDSKVKWQPIRMPELEGEGFTKQKMPEPRNNDQVERNGKDYDLLTFKTVISPSRTGELTLGPCEIPFNAMIPRARPPGRSRSPFDIFGDTFADPFFSVRQTLKAKAPAVQLTVKPLPLVGQPSDFSGAVGEFQFSAESSPKQVKVGDPITMRLKISGRGNFDRVSAPVIEDAKGWRTYSPSSTFTADDPINYSGTKIFEEAVIPETKKTATPVYYFSFFDPAKGKYVTLNSVATALVVDGEAPPPPPPVSVPPGTTAPAPVAQPDDIVGLRYDRDEARTFGPLYERREFWYAQGGVGVVLLGMTVLRLRRRPDAAALQKAALRQEKEIAWRELRKSDLGHADFFDAAARVAQFETALATGRPVAGIDAAIVRSAAQLDPEASETIDAVFNARAELHYAGGGGSDGQVTAAQRERVLGVLRQLEKHHARN